MEHKHERLEPCTIRALVQQLTDGCNEPGLESMLRHNCPGGYMHIQDVKFLIAALCTDDTKLLTRAGRAMKEAQDEIESVINRLADIKHSLGR